MKQEITLIVTTCNSVDVLKLFWKYIKRHTHISFKTIVVDNGSSDGTIDFLKSLDVVIIRNPVNVGVVKALNQAEKLVNTKYFLSISDDVLVTPNWLEDLIKVYESDKSIKTVAPIKPGTKIKYPYNNESSRKVWDKIKESNPGEYPSELLKMYCNGRSFEKFVNDIKATNNFGLEILESPPDFVSGCCVLVEKEFIDSIGGFSDTRFHIYSCEDVDRCWRIGKAGYKIIRTSNVFVHHFEGVGLFNNSIEWKKLMKKNNKLFIDKWKDDFWPLLRNKIDEFSTISDIVKNHWLIGYLLESLDENNIPNDLKSLVKNYLSSVEPKFKRNDDLILG